MTSKRSSRAIAVFLIATGLLSAIFYSLIIKSGQVGGGGGAYIGGLMWCPGLAALITWMRHRYQVGGGSRTSWLKVRNPDYSQWEPRSELFEARRDNAQHRDRWVKRRWPWCNASHAVPPFL